MVKYTSRMDLFGIEFLAQKKSWTPKKPATRFPQKIYKKQHDYIMISR